MPRIRTVKPRLFQHSGLFDAEHETGLPLRLAYIGLFTCCDREGRFKWDARELKLHVLPWDDVDFSRVLDALTTRGFVVEYAAETGEKFGAIPTFTHHQVINNRESASEIPPPPESVIQRAFATRDARVDHATGTRLVHAQGEGKGREGKGKERKKSANALCRSEIDRANGHGDDAMKIFAYWQERMGSPRSALSEKRRRLIVTALKQHSPADLCKAIRGCSKDPWHMGMNDRGRPFNSLELILRDEKHIEQFIAYDTTPPTPVRNAGPVSRQDRRRKTAEAFGFVPASRDDSTVELPPEDVHVIGTKH